MIIYYTKDFKEVLLDPAKYINISKFKLSSCKEIKRDEFKSINSEYILQSGNIITSPTLGYYTAEGIVSDTLLSLSIKIPSTDISKEDYTLMFVYYDDLSEDTEQLKLAFVISGNMILEEKSNGVYVSFEKLSLEPDRTIITIPEFKYKCLIELYQDDDLDFLEGKGMGNIYSLFLDNNEMRDFGYVSRDSYEAYLLEQRGDDNYDHLYTQHVNNYGLKTY